jgi:hypothetical protein
MGVIVEPLDEGLEALMDHGVVGDGVDEVVELTGGGKFAMQQEVGHFQKRTFFPQLVDGIASIPQYAMFPVDVGDGALATACGGKAWVVGENALLRIDPADIEASRSLTGLDQRKGGLAAWAFQAVLICQRLFLLH